MWTLGVLPGDRRVANTGFAEVLHNKLFAAVWGELLTAAAKALLTMLGPCAPALHAPAVSRQEVCVGPAY